MEKYTDDVLEWRSVLHCSRTPRDPWASIQSSVLPSYNRFHTNSSLHFKDFPRVH